MSFNTHTKISLPGVGEKVDNFATFTGANECWSM